MVIIFESPANWANCELAVEAEPARIPSITRIGPNLEPKLAAGTILDLVLSGW
jgi:hypothetical protein